MSSPQVREAEFKANISSISNQKKKSIASLNPINAIYSSDYRQKQIDHRLATGNSQVQEEGLADIPDTYQEYSKEYDLTNEIDEQKVEAYYQREMR